MYDVLCNSSYTVHVMCVRVCHACDACDVRDVCDAHDLYHVCHACNICHVRFVSDVSDVSDVCDERNVASWHGMAVYVSLPTYRMSSLVLCPLRRFCNQTFWPCNT